MNKSWIAQLTVLAIANVGILYVLSRRKARKNIPKELHGTKYDKELTVAITLALEAGKNILDVIDNFKNVDRKGAVDFVTETDKNNEKLIFKKLQQMFPEYSFIGEESAAESNTAPVLTNNPTWIVDPVDGTTNFVHSFPFTCVSIALVVERASVLGVVYNPSSDELYLAVTGHGSYLNGRRMAVSKATAVNQAMLMTEVGYIRDSKSLSSFFDCLQALLLRGAHAARMMGSGVLDLCFVASGRLDAAYCGVAGEGWYPWDYAAGSLMVTEAGGTMATLQGHEFELLGKSMIAASSCSLMKEISDVVTGALSNA